MMMLSEIAKALNAPMRGVDVEVRSVGTDSRNIVANQLFVAIKGEHFDGNAFAVEALKQGAAAALVCDASVNVAPSVLVDDTRLALGKLAQYWRNKFEIPLVAVTGSNGKTTVKEMITAILNAANGKVLATRGNLNNDIGVPLTLFGMNKHHNYAVVEMGMNHEGEIRYLTQLAGPNVAVINNAGTAHIGEVGSREGIARAKGEIFEGLADNGIAVINADDRFADYWKSLNVGRKILTFGLESQAEVSAVYTEADDMCEMTLTTPSGSISLKLNMLGKHNVSNALAASACAVALGVANADIANGLAHFGGVNGRLQRKQGLRGAKLIDDTYNANPDSMKAAIDVLVQQAGTHVFVMGDMGELGADAPIMHAEVGAYAKQKGVHLLLALGGNSTHAVAAFGANAKHFETLQSLLEAASGVMNQATTVLVKGSRFMRMEQVVNALEQKQTAEPLLGDQ